MSWAGASSAGERMNVAYEERDQENEHSCFSDNTTADLVANEQGIINVWKGTYPGGVTGDGLEVLVDRGRRGTLATKTSDDMDDRARGDREDPGSVRPEPHRRRPRRRSAAAPPSRRASTSSAPRPTTWSPRRTPWGSPSR